MQRPLVAILLTFVMPGPACNVAPAAYPRNLLCKELGAGVTTTAQRAGSFDPNALLSSGPISRGRFAFAAVDQHRFFCVDLGKLRDFDRVQLGASSDEASVGIEVSSQTPDGPYGKVCEAPNLGHFQTLRLPPTRARWLRFDFGRGSNRLGVHSVRIYKGYTHPQLAEVTQLLRDRVKPALPGLERFYAQARAADWPAACSELRAYFAANHKPDSTPNRTYDLSRAERYATGDLDFAGLSRSDPLPIDWTWMQTTDWYEHRNFLNRGSPLGVLADASYHSGDALWAERFRSIFYDWVDENPKPDEMSGADYPTWRTLDTAARLSWLVSRFAEVTATRTVDDELWANYLYSIWEHADYLKNDDFSGGNWLATITSAVTHAAQEFPELRDRRIWLEYGKSSFERNVLRDVYPDGKEMEDAPGYICMAYKAMLATLEALEQEGIQIDPNARVRLDKVQDFLAAVTQPNGIMPSIGDWGGCEPYALPAAVEYFGRDDIRYVLSKGDSGVAPSMSSVHFPYGGWTILRSPFTDRPYEHARHLVFKSSSGAHGHLDVLGLTAYAFGRELLIDPGIRSYERADVQRYLQTSYHNTICIDGENQPRVAGKTDRWFSNAGLDVVSGIFSGYPGLSHRRTVVFVRPDYWFVRDHVTGSGTHRYDQNWHFPADAAPTVRGPTKRVRTEYREGGNMLIVPLNRGEHDCEPFDFFIAEKRMDSGKTDTPAKGFRYTISGDPPKTFDVLLWPFLGEAGPSVSAGILVSESESKNAFAVRVTEGENTDYLFIAHADSAEVRFTADNILVNAGSLLLRTSKDKPRVIAGSEVREVVFSGKTLAHYQKPVPNLYLTFE